MKRGLSRVEICAAALFALGALSVGAHDNEINTVILDDPELFRHPIAYIIGVGWWTVTDREAAGLRAYLLKGGFLFVDDFKVEEWWRGVSGGGWGSTRTTIQASG